MFANLRTFDGRDLPVEAGRNIWEAAKAANFDFAVETFPLYAKINDKEIDSGSRGIYAMGKCYGTASDRYNPVTFAEGLRPIQSVLDSVPNSRIEDLGMLPNGVLFANVKIGDTVEIVKGDATNTRLFAANSINGQVKWSIGQSSVRIVCSNTFYAAMRESAKNGTKNSRKHTKGITDFIAEFDQLGEVYATIGNFHDALKVLSTRQVTKDFLETTLTNLFGDNKDGKNKTHATIMELFEANDGQNGIKSISGSQYALFNALTQYETHAARVRLHSDDETVEGKRLQGNVMGAIRGNNASIQFLEMNGLTF